MGTSRKRCGCQLHFNIKKWSTDTLTNLIRISWQAKKMAV